MEPVLKMSGISKTFPGVKALSQVDFELNKGEVHALVGENGAGKSTLMKILSGVYKADEGDIFLREEKLTSLGVKEMINYGISVIYQELNLIRYVSVAENIFLGREPRTPFGTINWRAMNNAAQEALKPFNVKINPKQKVIALGAAHQQIIEIAKALSLNAEVLVMDEPTSALTGNEADRLFKIINRLRDSGVSIIYITHRLDEVQQLADRVTVLRDGKHIVTKPKNEISADEIVKSMVGRTLDEQYPQYESKPGDEVLRVENLTKEGICSDVSFSARRGEILGFTGLVGAGRTEIMQTIFGYRKKNSGTIYLNGEPSTIQNCQDAVEKGIGLIPEERGQHGLVLGMSVFDNISLAVLDFFSVGGVLKRKLIGKEVQKMIKSMDIKTPSVRQKLYNLSGGNQQKVVLAKWFLRQCDIFIFDEPTRGIDVGAKVEIFKLMQKLAKQGAAVLMISSELPEVMNICDRAAIVFEGRIVKEFRKGELSEEEVMHYSLGLHEKQNENNAVDMKEQS